jgi:hypothetical protein
MPNLPRLNLLIILQLIVYSSFINPLLALSQEEGNVVNREEQLHEINSELPCLDSSKYLSKINYTYLTPSCLLPLAFIH